MAYNANEYERKLKSVMARHPNVKVEPMMEHEKMGLDPHEKKQIAKEIEKGGPSYEPFAKTVAHKGPSHVKQLHEVAKNHNEPGYREFAEDLAREFNY